MIKRNLFKNTLRVVSTALIMSLLVTSCDTVKEDFNTIIPVDNQATSTPVVNSGEAEKTEVNQNNEDSSSDGKVDTDSDNTENSNSSEDNNLTEENNGSEDGNGTEDNNVAVDGVDTEADNGVENNNVDDDSNVPDNGNSSEDGNGTDENNGSEDNNGTEDGNSAVDNNTEQISGDINSVDNSGDNSSDTETKTDNNETKSDDTENKSDETSKTDAVVVEEKKENDKTDDKTDSDKSDNDKKDNDKKESNKKDSDKKNDNDSSKESNRYKSEELQDYISKSVLEMTDEEFAQIAPTVNMSFEELIGDNGVYNGYPAAFPKPDTYKIVVDLRYCIVMVFTRDDDGNYTVPHRFMICSPGASSSNTPTGTFGMKDYRVRFSRFNNTNSYGQYWSLINGRIYFHSILYTSMNTSDYTESSYKNLGQGASHGCIRLPVPDARWIWYNIGPETTCIIRYGSKDDKEMQAIKERLKLTKLPSSRVKLVKGEIPNTDNWSIEDVPQEVPYVNGHQ